MRASASNDAQALHPGYGGALHDITIETRSTYQCARVEGVPPEEFGISRHARCIRDADYCFHDVLRSQARLIEQGYDAEQVKRLPAYASNDTIEAQARDTVDEGSFRGRRCAQPGERG